MTSLAQYLAAQFINIAIWFLVSIFTSLPGFLQNLILASNLRQPILISLRDRFAATLATAAQRPSSTTPPSFEALEYYVDPASAQILKFSALHAVSHHLAEQTGDPLPPTQLLPSMSTVLLQTEEERGGEQYLEAVATALAAQMQGVLLPVDKILLSSLLVEILGGFPEDYITSLFNQNTGSGSGGSSKKRGSSSSSGRKLKLAWEALQHGLAHRQTPVVVYIRSSDSFLCSSWERYDAFTAVFGSNSGGSSINSSIGIERQLGNSKVTSISSAGGGGDGGGGGGGNICGGPVIVVGGAILAERGAALVAGNSNKSKYNTPGGGEDAAGSSLGLFGGGGLGGDDDSSLFPSSSSGLGGGFEDDEFSSLASVLLSLNRLKEEPRPNPRKLLTAAFPTRVKLLPPPPGTAAAARHQARLQQDVQREVEKDNYSRASAVAAATGVKVPPRGSEIYTAAATAAAAAGGGSGNGALSKEAWEKVISWAASIETLQNKKTELENSNSNGSGHFHSENGKEEEEEDSGDGLRQRHRRQQSGVQGIRRCFSAAKTSEEYYTEDITKESLLGSPLPMPSLSMLSPSEKKKKKKTELNAAGGAGSGEDRKFWIFRLVEFFLQKIPGGQFILDTILSIYENYSDTLKTTSFTTTTTTTTAVDKKIEFPLLHLSEASLRYGIAMLQQSGGGPRATVQPENSYEKQLLSEVLSPEDLGAGKGSSGGLSTPAGFSHVGALKDAKRVLQETVQLPLQRPDLFQHGALAKPPSGVLLFGPPGTGKTLLARATAAESGASFLELSLSSLSSKYYGDSTKLVRAAFTLAEKLAPCVLFVDEVDALLGRRSSTGREHEATRELKNEFMSRWDSIRTTSRTSTRTNGTATGWVMVLGATNRPFDLDEAVLRRFSVRVAVELPDKISRRDILKVILSGQSMEESIDVEKIAEETEGFSGADLRQLCVAAAMIPIRELVSGDGDVKKEKLVNEDGDGKREDGNDNKEESSVEESTCVGVLTTPINSQITTTNDTTTIEASLTSPQLASAFTDATNLAQGLTPGGRGGGRFGTPATTSTSQKPRPLKQADFTAARRDVGPTVDLDSSVIQELKEWDKKYGSVGGANRKGGDARLLYYT